MIDTDWKIVTGTLGRFVTLDHYGRIRPWVDSDVEGGKKRYCFTAILPNDMAYEVSGDHVVGGPTEFSYEPGQVFTIACGQLLLDMRIDVLGDGVCSVIYRFRDN